MAALLAREMADMMDLPTAGNMDDSMVETTAASLEMSPADVKDVELVAAWVVWMGVSKVGWSVGGKVASTVATTVDTMADMRAPSKAALMVERTDDAVVAMTACSAVVEKGD